MRLEPASSRLDEFGGDALPREVLGGLDGRGFRHTKNPARLLGGSAAVDKFTNLDDVGGIFLDPVLPSQAAVKEAVFNIAGDLLGADEAAVEGGVVKRGAVRPAALGHREAGTGEKLEGGLFKAPFGHPNHQFKGFLTH